MPRKKGKVSSLGEAGKRKLALVLREFAAGRLHHGGTGKIVTDKDVALAIALSEARKHDRG